MFRRDCLDWNDSITHIKGIGPKSIQRFGKIGILTVKDLLFHFPFRYDNIQARDIQTILDEEKVTLMGKIISSPAVSYYGRKKSRVVFKLAVSDSDIVQVVFFNQPYLAKNIQVGDVRAIYGKWQQAKQTLLGMRLLPKANENDDFQAVYRVTQGLKQTQLLKAIRSAFEIYVETIPEILPAYINEKYRLTSLKNALFQMHFPKNIAERESAERKIIYQEFFEYQWRLLQASMHHKDKMGIEIHYDNEQLKHIIGQLPYELTAAQKKTVNEICIDLLSPYPMRRLLQGDVGSGKTLVAFIAMIASIIAGFQAVLMVPTEILAKQHQMSFNEIFEAMDLHAEVLVSAMKKKEKDAIIDGIQTGRMRIIIGTHALIQEHVSFQNLGLIIIDEQHRFGVGQRQALLNKRNDHVQVNLLQMTATPIPRSLAQSIYGDMQVSTIDQLPKGRQKIKTKVIEDSELDIVYQAMQEELDKGHQIYYVLPLIVESEELDQVESVESVFERLCHIFVDASIGILHGKQAKEIQNQMMTDFVQQKTQILIATTMVEVGVNVPNATMMIIQSAERFGLAQLHQLRGRVGRDKHQSYCYLIANPTTEHGKERMRIMEESQDGFFISQEDMKLRGMGDLLGRHQSGLPQFHYANLIEDQHILQVAQTDVKEIMAKPDIIEETEFNQINDYMCRTELEI